MFDFFISSDKASDHQTTNKALLFNLFDKINTETRVFTCYRISKLSIGLINQNNIWLLFSTKNCSNISIPI